MHQNKCFSSTMLHAPKQVLQLDHVACTETSVLACPCCVNRHRRSVLALPKEQDQRGCGKMPGQLWYSAVFCVFFCHRVPHRPDATALDDRAQNTDLLTYLLESSLSSLIQADSKLRINQWSILDQNLMFSLFLWQLLPFGERPAFLGLGKTRF